MSETTTYYAESGSSYSCGACGQICDEKEGFAFERAYGGVKYIEFIHTQCDLAPECPLCSVPLNLFIGNNTGRILETRVCTNCEYMATIYLDN